MKFQQGARTGPFISRTTDTRGLLTMFSRVGEFLNFDLGEIVRKWL